MAKHNYCIYLIPRHPVFNKDEAPSFENFSKENSVYLYSNLLLNQKENLDKLYNSARLYFIFDKKDAAYLPEVFRDENLKLFFGDTSQIFGMLKNMSEKYFNRCNNNLIVFSDSIGFSINEIQKALNLLKMEDETIVIGKSSSGKIAFLGFNSFNNELFSEINWVNLTYDHLLSKVSKHENYLQIMNGFLTINTLEDFKKLYKDLSMKESFAYCRQEMHEHFTNLFIEYKELLK